jgi:ArsR family transcriptional regulator
MSIVKPSFADLSTFNKAVGDPLRLEVLRVLAQDAYGVLELCDIFQHKQSGMSHHLKVLADAGLVTKRREGNSIFYSRSLPNAAKGLGLWHQQMYLTVDAIDVSISISDRLQLVQQERIKASQAFFVQQGDKFKAQQDLIAEYPAYGDAVADLLRKTRLSSATTAVEVGPGAGEFLPVLAESFSQVIALDNAPTMLVQAQSYCQQQALNNVEFIVGDTAYLAKNQALADCVVMNMVLHHTPSPADILADIALGLKPDGILIITDLCRHDQDWAKTACGDVWLGFDPGELQRWALLAGLQQGNSSYLALRNGFQVQLQQFKKV